MKNGLFALIAVCVFLGCPTPKHCNISFNLNEPFTLDQGATACLIGGDFNLHFDQVSSDSRCPIGVQCVWAGRADVVLALATGVETQAVKTQSVTLASGDMSQGGAGETTFEGYTVRLENVAPPAQEGKKIEQKDYRVKLLVTK